MLLVKNNHTAALHMPSVKGEPEMTIPGGECAPFNDEHWIMLRRAKAVQEWLRIGLLKEVEVEEKPQADVPRAPSLPPPPALRSDK